MDKNSVTPAVGPLTVWAPKYLVAGITVAMTVFLAGLIARMDMPLPWPTDYMLADVISGAEPLTLSWLYEPVYCHRLTLVKLIYCMWAQVTHLNLELMAYLMLMMYVAACVRAILTVKRIRGRYLYSDVVLPISLLAPLQMANIMSILQLAFTIPYMLLVFLACSVAESGFLKKRPPVVLAVATIVVAPHCSSFGFIVGIAAALWLMYFINFVAGHERRRRLLLNCMVIPLLVIHFAVAGPWGMVNVTINDVSRNLYQQRTGRPLTYWARTVNGISFLALWAGASVVKRVSALPGLVVMAGAAALSLSQLRILKSGSRTAKGALIAASWILLLAVVGTAATVGFSKDYGMFPRYYTLVCPIVLYAWFSMELLAGKVRSVVRACIVAAILVTSMPAAYDGLSYYGERREIHRQFVQWLNDGGKVELMESSKYPQLQLLFWPSRENFLRNMKLYRDAKMGIFG